MKWLRALLEKAVDTDGKLDVDVLIKSVNVEFPKHAIPKYEYNLKLKELKTANATIKELKEQSWGSKDLQQKVKMYEEAILTLQKENEDTKKWFSLVEDLKNAGCRNPEYLIFKHGGIHRFTFDRT